MISFAKNGQIVHGRYFAQVLAKKDWVSQFYVVQENKNTISLFLMTDIKPSVDQIKKIKNILNSKFHGMDINITLTDKIPTSRSGKFKYVVNKTLD